MNATRTATTEPLTPSAAPFSATARVEARTERKDAVPETQTIQASPPHLNGLSHGQAEQDPRTKKRTVAVLAALAGTVLVLSASYWWWDYSRTWVKTDNAYITGHVHLVSTRVAGTIKEVCIEENQSVAPGTVLARLEPQDFEVKRQQALASLEQTGAQSQQAKAQVVQARAQAARERAHSLRANQDLERAESLFHGSAGAISKQEYEQAKAEADAAEAALRAAQAAVDSAEALIHAARAQAQAAQANLNEAELELSYTEICAPAAGRLGKRNLETGNRVQPGQALAAVVEPEVWVSANFKETQLGQIKPGQMVQVRLDAFPGRTFPGHVESLSPASGAQFALLPPDNATGNFTRIVQRVPVKILLDEPGLGERAGRIVPGMSAIVEVNVRPGREMAKVSARF